MHILDDICSVIYMDIVYKHVYTCLKLSFTWVYGFKLITAATVMALTCILTGAQHHFFTYQWSNITSLLPNNSFKNRQWTEILHQDTNYSEQVLNKQNLNELWNCLQILLNTLGYFYCKMQCLGHYEYYKTKKDTMDEDQHSIVNCLQKMYSKKSYAWLKYWYSL